MEGCCTISISKKQSYLFPTLLRLSTKGLGTFAVVPEQVNSTEEVYVVRRPVFQLDMDMSCLQELVFPTVMIPDDIVIMPLDYWWLSQTNSLLPNVVRGCVEETILLYSFQLRDRQRPTFAFENIGILSCQDNVLMLDSGVSNGVTTAQGVQAAQAHMFPRTAREHCRYVPDGSDLKEAPQKLSLIMPDTSRRSHICMQNGSVGIPTGENRRWNGQHGKPGLLGRTNICLRHLSPRAIQVLHGLEPHQTRRNIFMFLAENNRRQQGQQEQQRQFCRYLLFRRNG
ncbi:hypothetical protein RLOC_00001779 [Lonchura striata]|uniref:CCDC81 HU domain-containing protein n=1 Tax=Lonchura striata TaxID=40157 RepID=A0A218UIM9_9PASE|nr:hypothetical protein RLOC_00001779 [Lonchura striata domestica]